MINPIDQFRQAIVAAGLMPPDTINGDGGIHRFSTNGKRGDDSGWYSFHSDGIPAGSFGCWRACLQSTWCSKSDNDMTQAEREVHRQRIKAMRVQREVDTAQRQQQAKESVATLWQQADPATTHPYLSAKDIEHHGAKVFGDQLLIPIRDTAGTLHSLQTIGTDGGKLFHTGGRVKGCYFSIGKPAGVLIVCEGYATGASIHECTGHAVAVAFSASNLEAVAVALRAKYPALKITVAADDDFQTAGNPGMTKAQVAAKAVGGFLATPTFPAERPEMATDFNDLHQLAGADAVKACIDGAIGSAVNDGSDAAATNRIDQQKSEDELVDLHRNAPRPDPACLYGLIGDIARAGSTDTEANPYAIAATALAYLGAALGRGPYMAVGDDWHHANLFMLHVGRSARGRKGTAKKLVLRLAKAVTEIDVHLAPQIHRGGLSTREGLALLIHDGWTEGKNEVPAIDDKRLLVVESEFANILHQSGRTGNTLSPALRDTWDGVSIKPATKTSRVWASNPHISMIADVTPSELLDLMHSRELTNGFANRLTVFWAEGEKVNPFPKPTPQPVIDELAQRVAGVLRFAGADRHVDLDVLRIDLSHDAATLYARLYRGELRDRSTGERIAGLLDRRAPALLRMAMLFALTDQSTTVEAAHIHAALAWVRYWVDSVKFIFQSAMDEAGAAEVSDTGDKIMAYLNGHGQATRSELTKGCFGGHVSKDRIDKALDELLTANPPAIVVEAVPRPNGVAGTPTKIYKRRANCAKSANCEHPRGIAADFDGQRSARSVRTVINPVDLTTAEAGLQFATGRTLRQHANTAETRMSSHIAHSSHTSQTYSENEVPINDVEVF